MTRRNHPSDLSVEDLLRESEIKRTRGSGPGGQHRNKVETAISIKHLPTGLIANASERRSQNDNRVVAIERLRLVLAVEHRGEVSESTKPSELWNSRRSGDSGKARINVSPKHDDFPSILAEALDFVHFESYGISAAANRLGISGSQLAKLLKSFPAAWQSVNAKRKALGLKALK